MNLVSRKRISDLTKHLSITFMMVYFFWFKANDLDTALNCHLNMDDKRGFNPLKLKGRNWVKLDECITRISSLEKLSSKRYVFYIIQIFKGFEDDPLNNYVPSESFNTMFDSPEIPPPQPPDISESDHQLDEMSRLKEENSNCSDEVTSLINEIHRQLDEISRLTDENALLKHQNTYLEKWGKNNT